MITRVSNFILNNNKMNINLLSDEKILELNLILNNIKNSTKINLNIKTPRLVTVALQSAAKSTTLNRIIGLNILPTGSKITTRCPLILNCSYIKSSNNTTIEIFKYKNEELVLVNKFNKDIEFPNLDLDIQEKLMTNITEITREYCGNDFSISNTPIILNIKSPNVTTLQLIDLPGLVQVALTGKGQKSNIKEIISNMIGEYIKDENTIILSILPARVDLEVDSSLELIKRYDKDLTRTIGIISKVDLLDNSENISDYLLNNVVSDLQIKLGYYALVNKGDEEQFFYNHPIYNKMEQTNIGINNLKKKIKKIIINRTKKMLPEILNDINNKLSETTIELENYKDYFDTKNENSRINYLNHLINDFKNLYIESIKMRGSHFDSAREIKKIFINYKKNLEEINPFLKYKNEYFKEKILSLEGLKISSPALPIDVLELTLQDKEKKPIQKFIPISKDCIKNVSKELIRLIDLIFNVQKNLTIYPNLTKSIKKFIIENIILKHISAANKKIEEIIDSEEYYIYTNNKEFINKLKELYKYNIEYEQKEENINLIKELIIGYYDTIKLSLKNIIPKTIMFFLIKHTLTDLNNLNNNLLKEYSSDVLLKETEEIHKIKTTLKKEKILLTKAKNEILNILD